MWITSKIQRVRELWSLVRGLGVTGNMLFKRGVTVHYPREEVYNLKGFRGPIALVAKPGDPQKPKCIACLMCMNTCPSHCITVVKMKRPKSSVETIEADTPKGKKPVAPKEPATFSYDYSLCSLCGLCVDVCPVDSICFSSDVYLVTQNRDLLRMDLLAKLKKNVGTASDGTEV